MDIIPILLSCVFGFSLAGCAVLPPIQQPDTDELSECRQHNLGLEARIQYFGEQMAQAQQQEFQKIIQLQQQEIKKCQGDLDAAIRTHHVQQTELQNHLLFLEELLKNTKVNLGNCQHNLSMCNKSCGKVSVDPPPTDDKGKKDISCGDYTLHFVKIIPKDSVLNIALTEDNAKKFYQQAQRFITSPLYPFVFKAVAENNGIITREVSEFWIQSEPIDERLYKKIITDGSVNSVSFKDAQKVIETLGKMCPNHQFTLPTEAQFVYLAREMYNPADSADGKVIKCSQLQGEITGEGVEKLLGNQWQLTKSECYSWSDSDDPTRECARGTFVKKGGTTDSKDATECLPEYRAESTPDVREPNTTLRLILEK